MNTIRFNRTSSSGSLFFSWNVSFCRGGLRAVDRLLGSIGQFGHVSCAEFEADGSEQTLDLVVRFLSVVQFLGYSFS